VTLHHGPVAVVDPPGPVVMCLNSMSARCSGPGPRKGEAITQP
jgi:hypothetical protein